MSPPGLLLIIKWTKTSQKLDNTSVLPIPHIKDHVADPVHAYQRLLKLAPTRSANQPLLTHIVQGHLTVVTTKVLSNTLSVMLSELGYDPALFSLHSFRRGGATAAYKQGVDVLDIKRHGSWKSDAFWDYITAPIVSQSKVAAALAASTKAH